MHSQINFGYPWPFTYGHLIIAMIALAVFALGWVRKWHKLLLSAIGSSVLTTMEVGVTVRAAVQRGLAGKIITGVVMLCYVIFGGMVATTWVQIVKAVLLMAGTILITVLVLGDLFVLHRASSPSS